MQKVITARHCFLVLTIFSFCGIVQAQTERTSVCALQENAEKFLNSSVEVKGLIFAGVEYPRINNESCSFRFARGDDYQTFGGRFPIRRNAQWKLLEKLLGTTECASNVRVVSARIQGTVTRVPATGTIPADEMPLELVIQSVSEVSPVPIKCTPKNDSALRQ